MPKSTSLCNSMLALLYNGTAIADVAGDIVRVTGLVDVLENDAALSRSGHGG